MDAIGLVLGGLVLLVALLLVLALLVTPVVLLVWFLRSGAPRADRR